MNTYGHGTGWAARWMRGAGRLLPLLPQAAKPAQVAKTSIDLTRRTRRA